MRFCERFSPPAAARRTVAGWLSGLSEALDALVFPWSCAVCGMEGVTGPFCKRCRDELLEQSASASKLRLPALRPSGRPICGFTRWLCFMPGPFAGLRRVVRDGIIRAGSFANYACGSSTSKMPGWPRGSVSFLSRLGAMPSVPFPPMPWSSRFHCTGGGTGERGYNQAEALAEGMAKQLKLPVRRLLKRVVGTRRLADLSRTARSEVMRNAFRARASFQANGTHGAPCR